MSPNPNSKKKKKKKNFSQNLLNSQAGATAYAPNYLKDGYRERKVIHCVCVKHYYPVHLEVPAFDGVITFTLFLRGCLFV